MKDNKFLYFGYLLIVGVIFYVLNYFAPLFSDDWHYNFIYGTNMPIRAFKDVLYSQYLHYFQMNGRFVPHFFVQTFDGMLGKGIFNVVNSVMFVVFIFLISYILRKEYKTFFASSSIALFFVFFLLPGFNHCFLWMSGACNYLWAAVFVLSFHLMLQRRISDESVYPFLFLYGIFCGWTNEAIVLGLGAGYFVYYVLNKNELNSSKLVLLSGFYIGLAFLVFSPGSIHRALVGEKISLGLMDTIHSLISALLAMGGIRLLPCLLLVMIGFYMYNKEEARSFIKSNILLFVAIIITFIFVLWTKHDSSQSRFGFEFFSLILILKIAAKFQLGRIIPVICNIAILIALPWVFHFSFQNYRDYQNCLSQITKNNNDLILTNSMKCPTFFERFIIRYTWPETWYCHSPYDKWISAHFYKQQLCFISERLYNKILKEPENYVSFNLQTIDPFYVRKVDDDVCNVKMILYPVNQKDIPFLLRPFANKFQQYSLNELEVNRYAIVSIDGTEYIFVNRHPLVDNRLKEIVIE